jgi:prevent-host-death family protein
MPTQEIAAGEFKAKCLGIIDEVAQNREEVIITKRGRPLAKLVPLDAETPELFGRMKASATIHGNIIADTDESWEADTSS